MTDHWDDFDSDFDDNGHHDLPGDPHGDLHGEVVGEVAGGLHDPGHDLTAEPEHHDVFAADEPTVEPGTPDPAEPVLADDPFPPALEVGDLPEPVDGFPWIDTATLGAADPTGFTVPLHPVTAEDLAAYAHTGGPADWPALADSDDPAISALARWWTPDEQ